MSRYRVMSDDNFHAGVKDDRSERGIYATAADAIKACQAIIDDSLIWEYQQCASDEGGPTGQQLYDRFADFGDSPSVVALEGAPKVDFVVKSYARKRAEELTAPGEGAAVLRQTLQESKDRRLAERAAKQEAKPENGPALENEPEIAEQPAIEKEPELENTPGAEKAAEIEKEQLSASEIHEESPPVTRETEQVMSAAELPAREAMEFDVVIVGAGPAGLAAAIRLKQLSPDISVVVVEKGSEVGAHILSGAVIDPIGLDSLIPEWRNEDTPIKTPVTSDSFYVLGSSGALRLPNVLMPPLMSNHGNFIVSLGDVCRYLAKKAEALGVEIYPGFAAAEVLYDGDKVAGIATGDMGIGKNGEQKSGYTRGMELRGKYTLFAEGARGSLTKTLIERFALAQDRQPQKFGIGLKELWQVAPDKFRKGMVQHTMGWPLDNSTGGGSFLYHFDDNLVSVGFVVHLNYQNPYLSPFEEFQRFKTHPLVRDTFTGGKRISYGARAITEGGYQSVPKLTFPGGALIGCAAGFVNVPRIKGSHNAMLSGKFAAEHVAAALAQGRTGDELADYEAAWRSSPIGQDLWKVRNTKPLWSKLGTITGISLGALDMWTNTLGFSLFGTLKHGKADFATLKPAAQCQRIAYAKPDGKLTFDRLSSVYLSNTNHEEDQPAHLVVRDQALQKTSEHDVYAGPSARYCPAGVYEWVEDGGSPRYVINAQNCVHCKTCDIKDPNQNITWVPPEGAGGPNYPNM
jgi:electron-transferring-flavoprotein dehydrogenase